MLTVIKHRNHYRWYDSDPDLWVLDQQALAAAFKAAGYAVDSNDHSDRFDIAVVNESTADEFLERMAEFLVDPQDLASAFRTAATEGADWWSVADFLPALYVDFDSRRLWSVYAESTSLETYVPAGWTGQQGDFFSELPVEERYWIQDDEDLLAAILV